MYYFDMVEEVLERIEAEAIENSGNLDLSGCSIRTIPLEICQLTDLKSLNLSGNNIIDITPISNLLNLESLDLSSNKITDIAPIENLTQLTSLNLSYNKIQYLSPLKRLLRLQILNVERNKINSIIVLANLKKIQVLILSRNNIQDFTPISKNSELLHLSLHKTKIKDLNKICSIENLLSLNLGGNSISDYSCLEKLRSLTTLNLSFSMIKNYDFLNSIKGLRSLNLNRNKLTDISFLYKLNKINNLSLSSNKIENINHLTNFTQLSSLNLDDNLITDLTPLIPILKQGLSITLQHGWGAIMIGQNPVIIPPVEIVKQGSQSVIDWFNAIKKDLKEIKIILIGDPKSGKTSLLRRLKENRFIENEVQTDGVNIERLEFGKCKTFEKQTSLHKLTGHFWDFGGQEIMHATHQFFLTKRSVYILVLDARKDNNVVTQIKQWVKRIKATGGNSEIIVVANQSDINAGFGFENEYELQKEFPQIKYFIKISCKNNENIDLLKEKLEDLIPKAELFNTEIDVRWIDIKEHLQNEIKDGYFLGEDRFREICKISKLEEKASQKNAISFLNDLGLVLHFNEVKDHEYYILDPYWITYGVYQILTSKLAGDQKGIVCLSYLEYIINEEEDKKEIYLASNFKRIKYNNYQRRFLLDILCQFKLCFYLPDRSHFIIPDLLETSESEELTQTIRNSQNAIQLIYDYEYLPKSIMPQILVETHFLHFKIWRTGCILKYRDCEALITNYDNQIRIKVTNGHKTKKDLLAIIRSKIDQININLTNNPNILIPLPGINGYADYEDLLERDKDGEIYYSIYKPEKRRFEISQLLEGISTQDEIKQLLFEIKQKQENHSFEHNKIISNLTEIMSKLDLHYQYLVSLPQNELIKDEIIDSIKNCSDQQKVDISNEIIQTLAHAFEFHEDNLDEKIKEIFSDFCKTDDVQIKLKLGIPLLNLLGFNIETEFDLKKWASKMYETYELKIFKIMGLV